MLILFNYIIFKNIIIKEINFTDLFTTGKIIYVINSKNETSHTPRPHRKGDANKRRTSTLPNF